MERNVPILQHLIRTYKLWHEFLPHIAKSYRNSVCVKIDVFFVDVLELIFIASYLPKTEKLPYISKSITKLDLLKFFLQTLWEIKAIDSKKYSLIFEPINKAGGMLGGWKNQLLKQTPRNNIGEK